MRQIVFSLGLIAGIGLTGKVQAQDTIAQGTCETNLTWEESAIEQFTQSEPLNSTFCPYSDFNMIFFDEHDRLDRS